MSTEAVEKVQILLLLQFTYSKMNHYKILPFASRLEPSNIFMPAFDFQIV
jgi:hypothetical protein